MNDEWDLDSLDGDDEAQDVFNYQITSYPADITLKGYADKWSKHQITIPDFQRNYVWDQVKASKLIESFLLGLPVPGVFLYKDRKTNKLAVIDGQQRILSAIRFFNNEFDERIFRLKNITPKWNGKTYNELDESDKLQLDDTVLRATVVQQLDPDDDSSIYLIFERLNTGGINLNSMEIRKCVYYGKLFDGLVELNSYPNWRAIISKDKEDKRLRDVELVLRVLALSVNWRSYSKPMKGFLNKFMWTVNRLDDENQTRKINELKGSFVKACDLIVKLLPDKPFHLKSRFNYAAMDSIFNALMNMSEVHNDIAERYQTLIRDEEFIAAVSISTSDDSVLQKRFARALELLAG